MLFVTSSCIYARYNASVCTQCSDLHDLSSNSSACVFVTCVESCGSEEGIIDYLNFIYCQMPFNLIPLAMVKLVSGVF